MPHTSDVPLRTPLQGPLGTRVPPLRTTRALCLHPVCQPCLTLHLTTWITRPLPHAHFRAFVR